MIENRSKMAYMDWFGIKNIDFASKNTPECILSGKHENYNYFKNDLVLYDVFIE